MIQRDAAGDVLETLAEDNGVVSFFQGPHRQVFHGAAPDLTGITPRANPFAYLLFQMRSGYDAIDLVTTFTQRLQNHTRTASYIQNAHVRGAMLLKRVDQLLGVTLLGLLHMEYGNGRDGLVPVAVVQIFHAGQLLGKDQAEFFGIHGPYPGWKAVELVRAVLRGIGERGQETTGNRTGARVSDSRGRSGRPDPNDEINAPGMESSLCRW